MKLFPHRNPRRWTHIYSQPAVSSMPPYRLRPKAPNKRECYIIHVKHIEVQWLVWVFALRAKSGDCHENIVRASLAAVANHRFFTIVMSSAFPAIRVDEIGDDG